MPRETASSHTAASSPKAAPPRSAATPRPTARAARVVLACLIAVWLLGLSFMIVLLSPVTHALADRTVNDQLGGFTHEELVALADSGLAYVTLGGGDPLPIGEDEYEAFTPEVIAHLDDVRTVLRAAMLLTVALTLAVAAMLIVLIRRGMGARALAPVLTAAGLAPLVCVVLLVIISMVSFDAVFATMHQLFFSEGTWTFAWDSLLIRIYPLTFWMGMGIVWAVALVFFSVLSLAIGLKLRKVQGNE